MFALLPLLDSPLAPILLGLMLEETKPLTQEELKLLEPLSEADAGAKSGIVFGGGFWLGL